MTIIHLTTGLPASGKSSFARQLVDASGGKLCRVNMDDLRMMLDNNNGSRRLGDGVENAVLNMQDRAVELAIQQGRDIVVDNTHLAARIPNRIKRIAAGRATFEVHDFTHVPLDECLRRDAGRSRTVGEAVIRKMHKRLTGSSWRLATHPMNDYARPKLYLPNDMLQNAVMCDIDGTLAIHAGRGPYDLDKCETDHVNRAVAHTLYTYSQIGHTIVLLSGRDGAYRDHTVRWLHANHVEWDELWMRPAGDRRGDDVVKAELFDAHVRNFYNVRFVLDDRDRVVRTWRTMGLECWQVNYGDF